MKGLLIILILVIAYVFYPRYDLMIKQSPFDEHSTLEGSGYLTEGRCRDAAKAMHARYYHCSAKNVWGQIFGTYTSYDPKERYADPDLFRDLHTQ